MEAKMKSDMGEPDPEDVRRRVVVTDLPSVHSVITQQTQCLYEECCALRRHNAQLARMLAAAYERIAGQQELLSRKAERCEAS